VAKRRSKEQLKADRIIKKELLALGNEVYDKAVPMSRRDTGRLQDEMNFRVAPDTTLTMYQMHYGAYNYPVGKTSGEKNALNIAMNETLPDTIQKIIGVITDKMIDPYKDNK
jgi:hypothetical protein